MSHTVTFNQSVQQAVNSPLHTHTRKKKTGTVVCTNPTQAKPPRTDLSMELCRNEGQVVVVSGPACPPRAHVAQMRRRVVARHGRGHLNETSQQLQHLRCHGVEGEKKKKRQIQYERTYRDKNIVFSENRKSLFFLGGSKQLKIM